MLNIALAAALLAGTGCSPAAERVDDNPPVTAKAPLASGSSVPAMTVTAAVPTGVIAVAPISGPAETPATSARVAATAPPVQPVQRAPTPMISPPPSSARLSFASLPTGPGRDVTQRLCSNCHAIDVVIARRRSPEDWGSIVNQMVNPGLVADDTELDTVQAYLSEHVGPAA